MSSNNKYSGAWVQLYSPCLLYGTSMNWQTSDNGLALYFYVSDIYHWSCSDFMENDYSCSTKTLSNFITIPSSPPACRALPKYMKRLQEKQQLFPNVLDNVMIRWYQFVKFPGQTHTDSNGGIVALLVWFINV